MHNTREAFCGCALPAKIAATPLPASTITSGLHLEVLRYHGAYCTRRIVSPPSGHCRAKAARSLCGARRLRCSLCWTLRASSVPDGSPMDRSPWYQYVLSDKSLDGTLRVFNEQRIDTESRQLITHIAQLAVGQGEEKQLLFTPANAKICALEAAEKQLVVSSVYSLMD